MRKFKPNDILRIHPKNGFDFLIKVNDIRNIEAFNKTFVCVIFTIDKNEHSLPVESPMIVEKLNKRQSLKFAEEIKNDRSEKLNEESMIRYLSGVLHISIEEVKLQEYFCLHPDVNSDFVYFGDWLKYASIPFVIENENNNKYFRFETPIDFLGGILLFDEYIKKIEDTK
jgi:hypothetical protein